MIAGEECTRGCRFCAVGTIKSPPPLDADEPARLADSVFTMGLSHAVVTVVNRDDLADSGAAHYKQCIAAVDELCPDTTLELLCSDLAGDFAALSMLLQGSPLAVFAHNVECVPRLDKTVRDQRASFSQSLSILEEAKRLRPDILTKSSIMVGMGETPAEVVEALQMLRASNVDIVTLGQYLAPSAKHLAVSSFPTPSQFEEWADMAKEMGFKAVASGPLVRSSYRAGELLAQIVQSDM
jgi:lipoic acid synthetase